MQNTMCWSKIVRRKRELYEYYCKNKKIIKKEKKKETGKIYVKT